MGQPSKKFLERSVNSRKFWDSEGEPDPESDHHPFVYCILTTIAGNWIAATPIPKQSFEEREKRLEGKDKELLLVLVRKILRWDPEERPSAEELFEDEFLIQWHKEVES